MNQPEKDWAGIEIAAAMARARHTKAFHSEKDFNNAIQFLSENFEDFMEWYDAALKALNAK